MLQIRQWFCKKKLFLRFY